MKIKYLLMAAFVLPCAMFIACGDDDDDDSRVDVDKPHEETKITNVRVDIPIDNDYVPSASYITGKTWVGEYQGWDEHQKKNTTIRRRLELKGNGTYTNLILGKLIESGKDQFFKFESEGGKFSYNANTKEITYTCEFDSLLNYGDQTYKKYGQKHFYSQDRTTYTEKVDFSKPSEGKRVWITTDTYLQSLTSEVLDLKFSMSEYAGDNQKDQNKN